MPQLGPPDERNRIYSLAMIVVVVGAVALVGMWQTASQAQKINDTLAQGRAAYAQAAADADNLWAALHERRANDAKALVRQFPDDTRSLLVAFCPVTADGSVDCESAIGPKADLAKAAYDFSSSAAAFDFQALTATSLLTSGKNDEARTLIDGPAATAYQQQKADGQKIVDALNAFADAGQTRLKSAQITTIVIVLIGLFAVLVIAAILWRAGPKGGKA